VNKLSALDAGFLYNESTRCPQHVASVQILEPGEGVQTEAFVAQLKALLLERLHLVGYFANKLQFVPFDMDHPVWVRDDAFDIDSHVHHARVAAPGGRAELEAKIAELHATPLDRSRPLWDIWVLSGLADDRIALYNRGHHACLDGMAGQVMIETIMDKTVEPRSVEPPAVGFFKRDEQSVPALLAGAMANFARFQAKQASAWMGHMETGLRMFQRAIDPSKGFGALADRAPATRFNRSVESARSYAAGELPLAGVKRIAKATGSTINDVFLAISAGGLRRYFERSGELPDTALIAGCPVSLRQPGDTATNNQVTMMMVSLATTEADPVRRLLKIAHSSAQAKGFTADVAASYDNDVSLPGLPAYLRAGASLGEQMFAVDGEALQMPCNVVISNVPGPREQLYCNGAKMLTHYPVSIPAHGQGVNITVQSYLDQMFFAITACARALPHAEMLRDDLLASFDDLQAALWPAAAHQDVREISDPKPLPAAAEPAESVIEAGPRAA
jgi:diacylglycerol O-acyltransferase